jgi:hypothetical protein
MAASDLPQVPGAQRRAVLVGFTIAAVCIGAQHGYELPDRWHADRDVIQQWGEGKWLLARLGLDGGVSVAIAVLAAGIAWAWKGYRLGGLVGVGALALCLIRVATMLCAAGWFWASGEWPNRWVAAMMGAVVAGVFVPLVVIAAQPLWATQSPPATGHSAAEPTREDAEPGAGVT